MAWDVFTVIGTIAFALSGAIVAMEEEYDLFGVYLLGIVTAFGGGAVRNVLLGLPVSTLWDQESMFQIALAVITIFFLFPHRLVKHWHRWGNLTDAIGLAAFAITGALHAAKLDLGIGATIFAAILTGAGGGIIRDFTSKSKTYSTSRRNICYVGCVIRFGNWIKIIRYSRLVFILCIRHYSCS